MAGVPEGFKPHLRKSGLTDPWEPLYSRRTDEAVILGLLAAEPHANSRGFVHGGLIAALADNAMGLSCGAHLENATGLVTVGMSIDYLAAARLGQWLEFTTTVLKTGRSLAFAQMLVTADGSPVARANATFSVQRAA
ncbi:MAG: thioesterase [Caulobacter sp.]|nr:thioesterase [Caulobacter sp.]